MIGLIAGFIIGAFISLFSYPTGIDEGYQRSYNHCVEQQAQKQMLSDLAKHKNNNLLKEVLALASKERK